jgi:enhancing lycopene biosynthesis protein 2
MPKIAVVLSGCGVYDGAEIHESVVTLLALDRAGAEVICAAPNIPQMHVIDHSRGEPSGEERNVAVESSRIARGAVADLADLDVADLDAIIFPGGFGAAKNLCDYAVKGPEMEVQADVARVVAEARAAGKPLAFLCIAPVIAAKLLPGVRITIGADPTTAEHIEALGGRHVECPVDDFVEDPEQNVLSAPAYMLGPGIKEVAAGIELLVARLVELAGGA